MPIRRVRTLVTDWGVYWRNIPSMSNDYYIAQEHTDAPRIHTYTFRIITTGRQKGSPSIGISTPVGSASIGGGSKMLAATAYSRGELERYWKKLND